jgi:hypothetical protein
VDPLAIIQAVNAEGSSEVESILTEGLTAMKEQSASMEERQVAAQEEANRINEEKTTMPLQVQQLKSQTDIQLAEMELSGKSQLQNNDLIHKENMQQESKNAKLDEMMLSQSGDDEVAES